MDMTQRITGHIRRDTAGSHFQTPWIEAPKDSRLFIESEELLLSCMRVLLLYHLHVSSEHLMVSIGQTDDSIISLLCRTRTITIFRHGLSFHLAGETAVDFRSEFCFFCSEDRGDAKNTGHNPGYAKGHHCTPDGIFPFFCFSIQRPRLCSLSLAVIRNGI